MPLRVLGTCSNSGPGPPATGLGPDELRVVGLFEEFGARTNACAASARICSEARRDSSTTGSGECGHPPVAGHRGFDDPERGADRPNTNRMLFPDARIAELYTRWQEETVGQCLRCGPTAHRPRKRRERTSLVGELTSEDRTSATL